MKFIAKNLLVAALAVIVAAPAMAADLNKGTKSYQKRDVSEKAAAKEAPESAEDVSKIAPAAGDQEVKEEREGKSLREEIRLPRKN